MFLIWCLLSFVSQRVTGHGWLPTRAVGVDSGHNIIWPLQSDHVPSPDAFCFNVDMTLFQKSSEDVKTSFIPSFLGISGLNHVKTIENPWLSVVSIAKTRGFSTSPRSSTKAVPTSAPPVPTAAPRTEPVTPATAAPLQAVTAGPLPALTAKGVEGQLGAVKIWANSTSLVIWQTWVNSG